METFAPILNNAPISRIVTPPKMKHSWSEESLLRNDETIISSISVTDIVFDDYLGNGIIEPFPK